MLKFAAAIEAGSEHPLAEAILLGAEQRGIKLVKAESFASVTGQGVKAHVEGKEVLFGNQRLLQGAGIDVTRSRLAPRRCAKTARQSCSSP